MKNYLPILLMLNGIFCLNPDVPAQQGDKANKDVLFAASGYSFPYDLSKPAARVILPNELFEISGLAWIGDNKLACVQDEDGIIFIVDMTSEKVIREIRFEEDGDYEGIELVGDDAYIIKSSGDIYRVTHWQDDSKRSTEKFENELSKKNDCEGLGFDPATQMLLIACKGFPHLDDKKGSSRKAVYRFDPEKMKLDEKPLYIIDLDQVKYYKKYNTMTTWGVELLSRLDESKGDVSFQPSGIAVHPFTGNIYITGAVGDLIIILHPTGEILAMISLDTSKFRQPEGICFDPEGNLYISNEGNESRPNLMKFNYKN